MAIEMTAMILTATIGAAAGGLRPLSEARIFGMCQEPRSPADIQALSALGCDVIVRGISCAWHASPEQARQRMAAKAHLLQLSRQRGITFCTMITSSALFPEIVPPGKLEEWASRDAHGGIIPTSRWHQGCLNNPEFRQFIRDIGRAVIDAGADGIHYDESYSRWFWMRPIPCFCDHCCAELRRWLKEHFSAPELKQRWGIDDVDRFDYRRYLQTRGLAEEPWRSPLHDQWWLMQLHSTYRWERWIVEDNKRYARTQYGRDLVTNANQYNLATLSAVLTMESQVYDFVNIGTGLRLSYRDGGVSRGLTVAPGAASYVPMYRMARAHAGGKPVALFLDIQHHPEQLAALSPKHEALYMQWLFAEAHLTGCFFAAHYRFSNYEAPLQPQLHAAQFIKSHPDWFKGTTPIARIAVLFSYPSQIWDMYGSSWSGAEEFICHSREYYGVCQALIRANIQWDTVFIGDGDIFPKTLSAHELRRYRIVIVPAMYCANDAEVEALAAYARAGGKLLVIGPFAVYDGRHEKRVRPLPTELRQAVRLDARFEPAISPDHAELELTLISTLLDRLGFEPAVAVEDPAARLQVHLRQPARGDGVLIDLLNCDFSWQRGFRPSPATRMAIRLPAPVPRRARLYTFSQPEGMPVEATARGSTVIVQVPEVENYALLCLER